MSALFLAVVLPAWLIAQASVEPEPAATQETLEAAPVSVDTPPPIEETPRFAHTEMLFRPTQPWSIGTAYVLPNGRGEIGVFEPLRYGWGGRLELETHPILDVVMPNVAVKKAWLLWVAGGVLSTRHNLTYPTGLLILLSRKGTGGILPHETRVPAIVALNNEVYFTRPLVGEHLVTARLGAAVSVSFGRNTLPTIDLPFVFPRMAAYYHHFSSDLGADVRGPIWGPLSYDVEGEVFLMPDRTSTVAVEGGALLIWQAATSFRAQVGARVGYSQLPFGSMWGWLPVADLIWAF